MITINWCVLSKRSDSFELLILEPENVLKSKYASNNSHFTRCPAFVNFYKNMYLIRSPIDISFEINIKEQYGNLFKPDILDLLQPRFLDHDVENKKYCASIDVTPYVFYSDESVDIHVMPPFLEKSVLGGGNVVSGVFNIGKWIRPIQCAFEFDSDYIRCDIKRNDPLLYINFAPKNSEDIVVLKRTACSPELKKTVEENTGLKDIYKSKSLSFLYSLREKFSGQK